MLKKLLTLSLVAVILSVTAFAAPDAISPISRALANEGVTIAVSQNNAVINDTTGLGGTVTLAVTSDAAYADAIVVTAVFDGTSFLTASITDAALTAGTNTKAITLPTALTTANNSYNVKFYLWESKTTLEPIAAPVTETVTPAAPQVAIWSGEAGSTAPNTRTVDEVTYYEIETGEDLAWFSNQVDAGNTTINAILLNDIYLNSDGSTTNDWKDFQIGDLDNAFAGIFDGGENKIINYYNSKVSDNDFVGFFHYVYGGTVKDVTFENAKYVGGTTSSSGGKYFASIVCGASPNGTFDNVDVSGTATAAADCYFNGFGSIVGRGNSSTSSGSVIIRDCDSSVNIDTSTSTKTPVTGKTYVGVGGIVGYATRNLSITTCTNSGSITVTTTDCVGGIIGYPDKTSVVITDCTNTGAITGYSTNVGQIRGYTGGTLKGTNSENGPAVVVIPVPAA